MNFCQNMQVAAASVTAKQMPKNYYPKQLENFTSNRQMFIIQLLHQGKSRGLRSLPLSLLYVFLSKIT